MEGVVGLSKKEKGLLHMDNSVVIAGERSIRGLNSNGKNIIKIYLKKRNKFLFSIANEIFPSHLLISIYFFAFFLIC